MVEFRWMKFSVFLMLLLHFTAAATGQLVFSFTVRVDEDVTLPCENAKNDQINCDSTTWLVTDSSLISVPLIEHGKIHKEAQSKSDRLILTANCSLVIKKVTAEDVGRYTCRQFESGGQQGPDAHVYLSVVTTTEEKDSDTATLSCFVSTYDRCQHRVKWLFNSRDLDKNNQDVATSQAPCFAIVTFLTSHYLYTTNYKLFTCNVTDGDKVQLFPFRPPASAEKAGEDTKTATTESTTTDEAPTNLKDCSALSVIMLVLRVAELLLLTVITVLLFRAAGNQRPPDDNTVKKGKDEDEDTVKYENCGDAPASVRLR